MLQQSSTSLSQQQQEQGPSVLPRAAWMWKPRSKKVIEDNIGGVAASFLGVRNFGAQQWKRRYVSVGKNAICYGKKLGKTDKVIPMETIRAANYATRDVLLSAKAPSVYADFGWLMYINGRELLFCCESSSVREEWVAFILAVLKLMSGLARPLSPKKGNGKANTTQSLVAKCVENKSESLHRSGAASGVASRSNTDISFLRSPDGRENTSGVSPLGSSRLDSPPLPFGDDAQDDTSEATEDVSSYHPDQGDENTMDDDMSEEVASTVLLPVTMSRPKFSLDPHARVLLPKAEQRYSHIEYKLDSLKDHIKIGDSMQNVLFSRCVEKIGKKDTIQERDLILTPLYLYLIAVNKLTGGRVVRCIGTDQIIGVIESTKETNVLAILIPSFHDILIRFHHQNSRVGGDETEVKFQLIAHLYKIHHEQNTGRRFVIREVENVRAVIRRCVDEQHLPLVSLPEDRMRVGTNKLLFPTLRTNAESVVYWSSIVTGVKADGQLRLRALVITDGAFYLAKSTLLKMDRHTPLADVVSVMYDKDSQTILIHCVEVDSLFTVQSSDEFARLIVLIPEVTLQYCGVNISATASKQLYTQAQLVDQKVQAKGIMTEHIERSRRSLADVVRPAWFRSHFGKPHDAEWRDDVNTDIDDDDDDGDGDGDGDDHHSHHHDGGSLLEKMPGSRGFLAQYRFVEELFVDFEDESRLLTEAKRTNADKLSLKGSFTTDFHLGDIQYSSVCNRLNLKDLSHSTLLDEKILNQCGVRRVLCVSTKGILLLHHGGDVGKLRRPVKGLLLTSKSATGKSSTKEADGFSTNDPRVDVFLDWSDITGLIRCYSNQGTVVGIMAGSGHSSDYMLDIETEQGVEWLICASASCYIQHNNSPPYSYAMFPLFTVPHAENVRNSLKKTVFDPKPTIALRRPSGTYTSDDLCLAVVPEIAEACRRFGDNTIYFSGVAWRFKGTASHRKTTPLKENNSFKKKMYKAFIIVLTNCAIYCCDKSGFEILRRTELLSLKEVFLSSEDPDVLLLTVPKEYDMYFRIDGRGKEFLASLQEAYTTWTDYGLHVPHESRRARNMAQYALLVKIVTQPASMGRLEKPRHFDEIQANHSAREAKTQLELFHCHHLAEAIAKYEAVIEAVACGQPIEEPETKPEGNNRPLAWDQNFANLSAAKAKLEFYHRRAYRFSLRSITSKEMERAQKLLYQHRLMTDLVGELQRAVDTEDLDLYERSSTKARRFPALRPLVEEKDRMHEKLKERRSAVDAVTDFINSSSRPPLVESEKELERLFSRAMMAKVRMTTLHQLRQRVDFLAQREQLLARLQTPNSDPPPVSVLELLVEAARQLEIPVSVVDAAFPGARCKQTAATSMCNALDAAVSFGDAALLRDVIACAESTAADEKSGDEADVTALCQKLEWSQNQLSELPSHEEARRVAARLVTRLQQRRRTRDWTAPEVAALRCDAEAALASLSSDNLPILERERRLVEVQLRLLAGEEHRLALRETLTREAQAADEKLRAERRQRAAQDLQSMRERERQEAEVGRRRREELRHVWYTRARRLRAALDESIRSGDSAMVQRHVQLCAKFEREAAAGGLDAETMRAVTGVAQTAATRGSAFLEALSSAMEGGQSSAELLALARAGEGAGIIKYVQTHEEELSMEAIAQARAIWAAGRERREWVQQLHQSIHTAFALGNAELLQVHIDSARAAGHTDEIIENAMEVVAAMRAREEANKEILENTSGEDEEEEQEESESIHGNSNESHSVHTCDLNTSHIPNTQTQTDSTTVEAPLRDKTQMRGVDISSHSARLMLSRTYNPRALDVAESLMGQLTEATLSLLSCSSGGSHQIEVARLWHNILQHRIRPIFGVLNSTARDCFDFLHFVGDYNIGGNYLAPYTNRLMADFERVKKFNSPVGRSSGQILVAFLLQRAAMDRVVEELDSIGPCARAEVLFDDALLSQGDRRADLKLLAAAAQSADWSAAVSESSGFASVAASARIAVTERETESGNESTRAAALRQCRTAVRIAVSVFSTYFARQMAQLGVQPSTVNVRALLDEGRHGEIGLLVHEQLLPALVHVLMSGFRTNYQFVRTRHVWEAVSHFGEGLQEGSSDISSVAINGAIQLVAAVTDLTGRNRRRLQRLRENELADIQLRMFLIECLNRNVLADFFRLFFQSGDGVTRWASDYGLWRYYDKKSCVCIPAEDEETKELMEIFQMLSDMPFVLVVDRELW